MKQVIIAGDWYWPVLGTYTVWNTLSAGFVWGYSYEREAQQVITTPGQLGNLYIQVGGAPGSGKSYTFTVRVNGADTDLEVVISDSETTDSDTTHWIDVYAGDLVSLQCVPSGSPSNKTVRWSAVFDGGYARESLILGCGYIRNPSTRYLSPSQSYNESTAEANVRQVVSTPGVIKRFCIKLYTAPGTSKSWTFTLRKNYVDTLLEVEIAGGSTEGSDTTHEVTVSGGDILTIRAVPDDSPANTYIHWGFTFKADNDGECLILGGSSDAIVTYIKPTTGIPDEDDWYYPGDSDEASQLCQACSLKNLYIKLSAAPGSGNSRTFRIRKNGEPTDLLVTISGGDTVGSNTADAIQVSEWDIICLQASLTGSPASAAAYWGITEFAAFIILPTVQTNPATLIELESARLNGYLTDDGGETCDCNFEWGLTESYGNETALDEETSPTSFWDDIASLNPATTYNFRAKAENQAGAAYGDNEEFCTLGGMAYWM